MATILRFALAFVLSAAVLLPAGALAQSASDADRAAIRSMISSQIEAFRSDDGPAAYAFASSGIKVIYPSVERFMAMVRDQYPPVYRPRSVTFGEFIEAPGGSFQKVYLTGPEGETWVAVYSLERQADGSWRIGGCTLIKDDSPAI